MTVVTIHRRYRHPVSGQIVDFIGLRGEVMRLISETHVLVQPFIWPTGVCLVVPVTALSEVPTWNF